MTREEKKKEKLEKVMTREEKKKEKLEKEKRFVESLKGKYLNKLLKDSFRETTIWKAFRMSFYIKEIKKLKNGKKKQIVNIDYFTGNKLTKRFNLHHLNLDSHFYTELERENFIPLNPQSHDCLHWFYTQTCKDKDFERRFLEVIHKMQKLNNFKDVRDFNGE